MKNKIDISKISKSIKNIPVTTSIFLAYSLIFGLLMIKIIPPLQAPDELGHFSKAIAFSEFKVQPEHFTKDPKDPSNGNWNTFGFKLPKEVKSMNEYARNKGGKAERYPFHYLRNKIKGKQRAWVPTGGITNYYFLNYIPQIIGIGIGKLLDKPIVTQYYLARIFNLISYVVIILLSLRFFTFSKMGAVILALNPMALFLASTASGDAMLIACCFFFISWMTHFIEKKSISKIEILLSILLLINLVLMKPNMIVLGLFFFLIPNDLFSAKDKFIWGVSTFFVSILLYLLWNHMMIDQQVLYSGYGNPSRQLDLFIKNPLVFFRIIIKQFLFGTKGDPLIYSFAGMFGLYNVPLGLHWVLLYFFTLVTASITTEKESMYMDSKQKWVVVLMFLIYTLLTFFALYQIWNKPGERETIEGLQGRYFIPISLAIVPLFSRKNMLVVSKKRMVFLSLSMGMILVATVITLSIRYT